MPLLLFYLLVPAWEWNRVDGQRWDEYGWKGRGLSGRTLSFGVNASMRRACDDDFMGYSAFACYLFTLL